MTTYIPWNLPPFLGPKVEVILLLTLKHTQVCHITCFLEYPPGHCVIESSPALNETDICYKIMKTLILFLIFLGLCLSLNTLHTLAIHLHQQESDEHSVICCSFLWSHFYLAVLYSLFFSLVLIVVPCRVFMLDHEYLRNISYSKISIWVMCYHTVTVILPSKTCSRINTFVDPSLPFMSSLGLQPGLGASTSVLFIYFSPLVLGISYG